MTREGLLDRLAALGLRHTTRDHPAVFRVEDGGDLKKTIKGAHTKNLFLKDARGRLWLLTARAEAQVDLKAAPARIGAARLSFGSEPLLTETLGVRPGSVTPFALVNDPEARVTLVLDQGLREHEIWNFHPLTNEATTSIAGADFLRFLDALGRRPIFADLGPSPDCAAPPRRPS
jgi:Ala-tRNA(Pro) deacylase